MKPASPLIALAIMVAIVAALVAPVYLQSPTKAPGKSAGRVIAAPSAMAAPLVPFLDGTGNAVDLAAFRGRVVVLNIWAKWCTPCVEKLPDLDRLHRKLAARNGSVVALNIDTGGGPELVRNFYRELTIENLAVYADPTAQGLFTYANKPWPKKTPVPDWYKTIGTSETKVIKIPPPSKGEKRRLPDRRSSPERTTVLFEAPSIPVTLIIDADGNVRASVIGNVDWDDDKTVELVLNAAKAPT